MTYSSSPPPPLAPQKKGNKKAISGHGLLLALFNKWDVLQTAEIKGETNLNTQATAWSSNLTNIGKELQLLRYPPSLNDKIHFDRKTADAIKKSRKLRLQLLHLVPSPEKYQNILCTDLIDILNARASYSEDLAKLPKDLPPLPRPQPSGTRSKSPEYLIHHLAGITPLVISKTSDTTPHLTFLSAAAFIMAIRQTKKNAAEEKSSVLPIHLKKYLRD
ncbi:hypothetical protein BY996DRAFT_6424860 [Phakopsora pachyrhizi]|nr:hypothetical protein BY996DRAFT_6424860 [Phakopsora pachyrhizi]